MPPRFRSRTHGSGHPARSALLILIAVWLTTSSLFAQPLNPVRWSASAVTDRVPPGASASVRLVADIDPGWHLYSFTTPRGGPIPTSVRVLPEELGATARVFQPAATRKFDPNFNLDTETFENRAEFLVEVQLPAEAPPGPLDLSLQVRNQSCDDKQCLPPKRTSLPIALVIDPAAPRPQISVPDGYSDVSAAPVASGSGPGATTAGEGQAALPQPAGERSGTASPGGMGTFLLIAFGFGLAAIFTPCVFPMIPITMSFFLNRPSGSRRDSIVQAAIFCLGIVFLFTAMGLAVTAILGPFGIVQIGSNIWVNLFIAAVFLIFGLSLLGAFEITIPSGLLTRLDSASRGGGSVGTLLMGLTFSLTAFACVGPFVGTLLAASVQSGGMQPLLGMASFASGLALPFFLLAVFPSYLQRLPKSGGWLARVKIVMGFIILAASLKYLSNVDQVMQLNWITRERFLAAWIVLFSLAGLYLLGFLRMPGFKPDEPVTLPRLLIGAVFLIFSISLTPGIFGGRLGELDAFVPYATETSAFGGAHAESRQAWMKNQYREALDRARAENKLVFVSFTGYACTNCHWMKANMFPRPEIAAALDQFVLLELYTDGTDKASEENQALQESKFSTVAIPYYAILTPDEQIVAHFPGLTRRTEEFLAFLQAPDSSTTAARF
jgi:thiol:disulfide interchange protein